jgi:hypothetical protein
MRAIYPPSLSGHSFFLQTENRRIRLTLPLFVLGVFANDGDPAFAADNLAFFADSLNRSSYFHGCFLLMVRADSAVIALIAVGLSGNTCLPAQPVFFN